MSPDNGSQFGTLCDICQCVVWYLLETFSVLYWSQLRFSVLVESNIGISCVLLPSMYKCTVLVSLVVFVLLFLIISIFFLCAKTKNMTKRCFIFREQRHRTINKWSSQSRCELSSFDSPYITWLQLSRASAVRTSCSKCNVLYEIYNKDYIQEQIKAIR